MLPYFFLSNDSFVVARVCSGVNFQCFSLLLLMSLQNCHKLERLDLEECVFVSFILLFCRRSTRT